MSIVFIADFFIHQIFGGGELVNEEIIKGIERQNIPVKKINSNNLKMSDIKDKNALYIIGNFLGLSPQIKEYIQYNLNYYIVEHDHKYVINRDVSKYKNHLAPKNHIINQKFYENAKRVYCQSHLHSNVVAKNLNIDNIVNLSTSIWSDKHLNIIEKNLNNEKNKITMVLGSQNPTKNTIINRRYCITKNLKYDVVGPLPYEQLMNKLSTYETFVFIPKVLETYNRLLIEARILGCKIITNNLNGCTSEPWFDKYKGKDLLNFIKNSRVDFINKFVDESVEFYKHSE
jgi:hypothetical protein